MRSSSETKEDGSAIALVGIHTRGAVLSKRLHEPIGELSDAEVPLGDIDISFYRDDVGRRERLDAPVVHDSHLDFEPRPHGDPGRRRPVHRQDGPSGIDALFDYGRPARSSWRSSPTAATASCRSGPTTSARTFRPRPASGSTYASRRPTSRDEVAIVPPEREPTRAR